MQDVVKETFKDERYSDVHESWQAGLSACLLVAGGRADRRLLIMTNRGDGGRMGRHHSIFSRLDLTVTCMHMYRVPCSEQARAREREREREKERQTESEMI